jgi:transaldolase/glucose-6-phosphate isomerase
VASFFVSRVDTQVDKLLDEKIEAAADEAERRRLQALKARAGVANAKVAYERFRSYLNSREWQLIAASGAKVQRVLWASTGVKNPAYPDTVYVDELIGEHTVSTMPEETWKAFRDHGTVARTIGRHIDDAHRTLRELGHVGIDLERVGAQLQEQGIDLFADAFDGATRIVEEKRVKLLEEGS